MSDHMSGGAPSKSTRSAHITPPSSPPTSSQRLSNSPSKIPQRRIVSMPTTPPSARVAPLSSGQNAEHEEEEERSVFQSPVKRSGSGLGLAAGKGAGGTRSVSGTPSSRKSKKGTAKKGSGGSTAAGKMRAVSTSVIGTGLSASGDGVDDGRKRMRMSLDGTTAADSTPQETTQVTHHLSQPIINPANYQDQIMQPSIRFPSSSSSAPVPSGSSHSHSPSPSPSHTSTFSQSHSQHSSHSPRSSPRPKLQKRTEQPDSKTYTTFPLKPPATPGDGAPEIDLVNAKGHDGKWTTWLGAGLGISSMRKELGERDLERGEVEGIGERDRLLPSDATRDFSTAAVARERERNMEENIAIKNDQLPKLSRECLVAEIKCYGTYMLPPILVFGVLSIGIGLWVYYRTRIV